MSIIRDLAIDHILDEEGGLVNNPKDPGGITNFGISIRFAGSIRLDIDGDGDTDAADIRGLTRDEARSIYVTHFWNQVHGDQQPPALAFYCVDTAVNMGVSVAIRLLQRAVGAADDGKWGPQTLAKVQSNTLDVNTALWNYHYRRVKRYTEIEKFSVFGKGWVLRAARVGQRASMT